LAAEPVDTHHYQSADNHNRPNAARVSGDVTTNENFAEKRVALKSTDVRRGERCAEAWPS
jgi:hypothetical protein